MREYTPEHICEEEPNMPLREYAPEHICTEQATQGTVAVADEPIVTGEEHTSVTYTQACQEKDTVVFGNNFKPIKSFEDMEPEDIFFLSERLPKSFVNTKKWHILRGILAGCLPAFLGAGVTFMIFSIVALLDHVFSIDKLLACILLFACGIACYVAHALTDPHDCNKGDIFSIYRGADAVYATEFSANSRELHKLLLERSKGIDVYVYRPHHCTDTEAFNRVVNDKHRVLIFYNHKQNAAVIVDPLLFK